jgi:hypothetical protein
MENKNIKISDKEFTSLGRADTVRLTHDFKTDYFNYVENPELLEIPVITYRLIFKIISDLRNDTFNTSEDAMNPVQLQLFDAEFKTQDNTYARFKYKISDIDKNRNYKQIEDALKFLVSYKSQFYEHKNAKGQRIKSFGGLITEPSYTKGYLSFLISSYWLEKLVRQDYYNHVLFNVIDSLKDPKHILFYLWILNLGDEGTSVHFTTLTKRFGLNYKSARDVYTNWIYPFRKKLNAISDESFNCSVKGNKIGFKRYKLVPTINLKEETISKLKIKQKISYFKVRHHLEDSDLIALRKLISDKNGYDFIEEMYKNFIKKCRIEKKKSSEFKGKIFLDMFQILISEKNINCKIR